MSAKLAPNFDLDVAVMTNASQPASAKVSRAALAAGVTPPPVPRRFHEATSPFSVERQLQISITPKRKKDVKGSIRPGEEIELVIKATDPQGKPVSAEISLGMVEQALLALFNPNVPPIDDFFKGTPRESALHTTTSAVFAYAPTTHSIDRHLLNELEREEIAKEEAEHTKALQLAAQLRQEIESRRTAELVRIAKQQESLSISGATIITDSSSVPDPRLVPMIAPGGTFGNRFDDARGKDDQVEFDSLSDLMNSNIQVHGWIEAGGGVAATTPETNLGLVVSQSQNGQTLGEVAASGADAFNSIDRAAIPEARDAPIAIPNKVEWGTLSRSRFKTGPGERFGNGKQSASTGFALGDVQYQAPGQHFNLGTQAFSADGKSLAAQVSNGSTANFFGGYGATVVMGDGSQRNWSFALSKGLSEDEQKQMVAGRAAMLENARGWSCRSEGSLRPVIGIRPS